MSTKAAHAVSADRVASVDQRERTNVGLHVAFAAALCVLAVGYADSYRSLVHIWLTSGSFQFAILIPPICAVLVWSRRRALARVQGQPRPWILGLALALVLFWLVGATADINLAQHFAVVALLPVLLYAFYGPRVAALLAFPMGYIFFAVPYGDFMVGPLQDITARLSVWLMHFTDVPVFKDGRFIQTPAALWHVAEACSGVKFFIATTAFGVLYAYLFFTSLRRRLVFVACAMVVPVIANALRVFFTILIGEHFGIEYATGTDHMIFGWQFFGAVLVLLFFAGWPFHQPPADPLAEVDLDAHEKVSASRILTTALLCLCVLAAGPLWFYVSQAIAAARAHVPKVALPQTLEGRHRETGRFVPETGMRFVDPAARSSAVYAGTAGTARVDRIAYIGLPGDGGQLITVANRLYDPQHWEVVARRHVEGEGAIPAYIRLTLASKTGSAHLQLSYARRVGTHWQTSRLAIKGRRLWYGLTGRAASTELIAITSPATSDVGGADAFSDAVLAYAAGGGNPAQ